MDFPKIQKTKSLRISTKYSVGIWDDNNQTVLIISCIENIKKIFFAGLRPARMQGLKNNLLDRGLWSAVRRGHVGTLTPNRRTIRSLFRRLLRRNILCKRRVHTGHLGRKYLSRHAFILFSHFHTPPFILIFAHQSPL